MEMIVDIKGTANVKRMLDPKLVRRAEPRAINKTGGKARTAQSVVIRKKYNITAKRLNEELEKVSGPNRATVSNPRAIIRAKKLSKRNPGLQHYTAKQVKKGVSYRIRKDKGRMTRPGTFFATMPEGGRGVFIRSGEKKVMKRGRYVGKERETIIRQTGPSVYQMMKRVGIKPIKQSVGTNFARLFRHEYQRELDRRMR